MYTVKRKRTLGIQTGMPLNEWKDNWTQTGVLVCGSYNRFGRQKKRIFTTYDNLRDKILHDMDTTFEWLKKEGLIAVERNCPKCGGKMAWVQCKDRSDGVKRECRRKVKGKGYCCEVSIRKDSWFEKSNMTLQEIIKYIYWWTTGMEQAHIRQQFSLASNTGVDWDCFCREVCEIVLMEESCKLGGPGKTVQIDESKIGKRKYHRWHHVEGQWVFGGIEEGSRKCFIVPVDTRSEAELLPVIKRWIEPGTLIICDCWKSYCNLEKNGFEHATVNHSKEFVNKEGNHTNKIEGQWRHMKASMPRFGVRKHMYSGYLAEFLWRYLHKEEDLFEVFVNDITKVYRMK